MGAALLETEVAPVAPELAGALHRPPSLQRDPFRESERMAAWERFESLPMPSRTDEAWRFASGKALDLTPYQPAETVPATVAAGLVARSSNQLAVGGRMVFANDELIAREMSDVNLAKQGVLFLPLEEAAAQHPELFQRHFLREEAILGSRKFAALHETWMRTGTFLYVPRGVEIAAPLETFHWLHGTNAACFPHTLIVAEENSRVTLIDRFGSSDPAAPGFACGVNDLWLGTGANVTYVNVQEWGGAVKAVQMNSTVVGRDASAISLATHLGAAYVRSESVSHLRQPGGRSDILSLAVLHGRRELDQRTLQIHESPHTTSDLLYKLSLDDQARSIYSGLIRVAPGAHFTDAYQKVRNLLLSDEAEANSAPGLEIEADNVRCTHGATSGQVEADELFYLLSRGIPMKMAQQLIVRGFLQEVLDRLPNEHLRNSLAPSLDGRFR